MPTLTQPLRFAPYLRPMVWGGRRLAATLNKDLPTDEPYGESWDLSDHPSHRTVVPTGPFAGRSVRDLMEAHRADLLGDAAGQHTAFPWLVKFLDARDWLSVQVHPDDVAAPRLWPGERGKSEAWFILDAEPGARIWAGLKSDVTERRLRLALEEGGVLDCLHEISPEPGQCLFLPAGTVHAVGGGVLLAEVQQTSDATFRLYDWNRKNAEGESRPLHLEQGLAAIDWKRGPIHSKVVQGFPGIDPANWERPPDTIVAPLVRCPYFDLDFVQGNAATLVAGGNRLSVLIMLAGKARFESGEETAAGDVWLLPASMPASNLNPTSQGACLLLCSLPG